MRIGWSFAVLAAAILACQDALASFFCTNAVPYPVIERGLPERYGERPLGRGATETGERIELWVAPVTRTFSIVIVTPDDRSCIVSSGDGWDRTPPVKKPDEGA